jgi:hypothetical protein
MRELLLTAEQQSPGMPKDIARRLRARLNGEPRQAVALSAVGTCRASRRKWSRVTRNIAPWDRVARCLLGALLLLFVFSGPKSLLGWLGLLQLATGLVGSCPLYRLFGVSTCARR